MKKKPGYLPPHIPANWTQVTPVEKLTTRCKYWDSGGNKWDGYAMLQTIWGNKDFLKENPNTFYCVIKPKPGTFTTTPLDYYSKRTKQ